MPRCSDSPGDPGRADVAGLPAKKGAPQSIGLDAKAPSPREWVRYAGGISTYPNSAMPDSMQGNFAALYQLGHIVQHYTLAELAPKAAHASMTGSAID